MDKLRRSCTTTLALGLLVAPPLLVAATDHSAEGPYSRLEPAFPTDSPGKIEVLEFLWYGCPHCAKVEPFVEAWSKKLPPDVVFRREHIVWEARPETVAHARMFASLKVMGILGAHQQAVFDAVQAERIDFRNEKAPGDWAAKQGLDRSQFEAMYKSFSVHAQIARLKSLTATYRIEGVPAFFVNGRYLTEPHRAGGERQVLEVIDRLVALERAGGKR